MDFQAVSNLLLLQTIIGWVILYSPPAQKQGKYISRRNLLKVELLDRRECTFVTGGEAVTLLSLKWEFFESCLYLLITQFLSSSFSFTSRVLSRATSLNSGTPLFASASGRCPSTAHGPHSLPFFPSFFPEAMGSCVAPPLLNWRHD